MYAVIGRLVGVYGLREAAFGYPFAFTWRWPGKPKVIEGEWCICTPAPINVHSRVL